MALFTLTINNLSPALEKQAQEAERINRYMDIAMHDLHGTSGKKVSGSIVDAGTTVGSWNYTAQASS